MKSLFRTNGKSSFTILFIGKVFPHNSLEWPKTPKRVVITNFFIQKNCYFSEIYFEGFASDLFLLTNSSLAQKIPSKL